jgi:hypothetical protein
VIAPFGELDLAPFERLDAQRLEIPAELVDVVEQLRLARAAGAPFELLLGKGLEDEGPARAQTPRQRPAGA